MHILLLLLPIFGVIDVSTASALIAGLAALGGLVVALLKFGREDTSAVVTQQSTLLQDMKTLNDELVDSTARMRSERDHLLTDVDALRKERDDLLAHLGGSTHRVTVLEQELASLRTDQDKLRNEIVQLTGVKAKLEQEIAALRGQVS